MANQQGGGGPFEPGDRTVLKPRPGAGRPASPASAPPPAAPPPAYEPSTAYQPPPPASPQQDYGAPQYSQPPPAYAPAAMPPRIDIAAGAGMDPLYQAAGPLLMFAGSLRHTTDAIDIASLRRQLVNEVRTFEERAKAAGVAADQVGAARYALCATVDESILATPWGANSDWGAQSLLVTFHRETWGGEKFFQLIQRTSEDPARYAGLLEILYVCLGLGFAGKFALDPQGGVQRDRLMHELHERIRHSRGPVSPPLSERWQGVQDKRNSIVRYVPWWVVAAAGLAIVTGAYLFFRAQLSDRAEPLLATLSQVGLEGFASDAAPVIKPAVTLKQLLAGPESERQLTVEEEGGRSTVILSAGDLFASGSAQVSERYRPVLQQVADALNQVPGQVLVVGHSDDQPVRSFRYQNNYELSADRADAVVRELTPHTREPTRLRSTGVGSSQPRHVPADTQVNRALNRRVEIVHVATGAPTP
jgi:type VI secretion system protein ImpK